jgi:glycosyltransferase involved in cell wall biosynthesis
MDLTEGVDANSHHRRARLRRTIVSGPVTLRTGEQRVLQRKDKQQSHRERTAGMYLAVLPSYRQNCMEILLDEFPGRLELYVSESHLDSSVKSGVQLPNIHYVTMRRLMGNKVFLQTGYLFQALRTDDLVVDLNPRSLSAWMLLVARRILHKRTLVWGHLYPRAGSGSKTVSARRTMRRLASGTITYTYSDQVAAEQELPGQPVWAATNALYRTNDIRPVGTSNGEIRTEVLYVGRFEFAKKVPLLLEGFAQAVRRQPELQLRLVGGGSQEVQIRHKAHELGIADKVMFEGWVDDVDQLKPIYERAICAVSPGFAGLGLTQCLGFGVPMVVSKNEPHAPEIELADTGGVIWFETDSTTSMADGMLAAWRRRGELPLSQVSEYVRDHYSAESMARGLHHALEDVR